LLKCYVPGNKCSVEELLKRSSIKINEIFVEKEEDESNVKLVKAPHLKPNLLTTGRNPNMSGEGDASLQENKNVLTSLMGSAKTVVKMLKNVTSKPIDPAERELMLEKEDLTNKI
jgi:hypothetical protein